MGATRPPLDYLATCSQMSLESVELSRLNLASNLRKEFQEILDEWIESEVDARLARSILDWRRAQDAGSPTFAFETASPPPQYEQLAIAFLPESRALPAKTESEHDRRSPRDALAPKRDASLPIAPSTARNRNRKRGEPRALTQHDSSSARARNDSHRAADKSLGSAQRLLAFSPRSTPLAKAVAANFGTADDLVEPLRAEPQAHRKSTASTNAARKPQRARTSEPSPHVGGRDGSRSGHIAVVRPIAKDEARKTRPLPLRAPARVS